MKQKTSPTQKVLNTWAIVLIIWSIYRAKFQTNLPLWFDEFIAKPVVFLMPVYYFITRVEKKDFFEGIDFKPKIKWGEVVLGITIGLFFFASGLLSNYVKYHKFVTSSGGVLSINTIILYVFVSLATSISEEVLSRGFVLKRLFEDSKNIITSSFLASILFFFLHVPILFTSQKIIGFLLLRVMVTDMILSLAISILYLQKRSLIIPILIHTFYNLSIYMFL